MTESGPQIFNVALFAQAMHDADWSHGSNSHLWVTCAVEGHRSYYPRVATIYIDAYGHLFQEEPAA